MSTKKSYKEVETLKVKGTKKYQQRIIEEKEAEDMLRSLRYEYDERIPDIDPNKLQLDKDGV